MSRDLVRQIVVAVSAVLAVVGGFIGSGAAGGTKIADAAGGALSADSTPIAPGGPAFGIWTVIYLGLLSYAVWQLLPAQRDSPRQRRLGYPIAASLLLNAAWILSVQAGQLWLSVAVIVALLAVLVYAFLLTLRTRPDDTIEAIVADGTIGLYLGWVCVATIANVAAALKDSGFTGGPLSADTWGAILAAVAGLVGIGLAVRGGGRLAPTASLCWGLTWVAVARLTGELESMSTAVAAIIAVVLVLVATAVFRIVAKAQEARATPGLTSLN